MDIPQVLEVLRPGEDWGPCAQSDSTYADLAATWRGTSPVPTEAEMLAAWAELEATRDARALSATRAAALPTLLTRADVTGVQVRIIVDALATSTNDRLTFLFAKVAAALGTTAAALEAEFGRPVRVLAPELLAYVAANPTAGDPVAGGGPE